MTPEDYAFTVAWWDRLLADDARMVAWLQKLHGTEFSGYQDNRDAASKWTAAGSAHERIFHATGDDEMRHADLLVDVLKGRGAWPIETPPPESAYWAEMERINTSLESCAAIFHLGERLAAERFQVLYEHPGTPSDIMGFLISALPDEQHHARVFRKMTDPTTLKRVMRAHDNAVRALKGQ